VHPRLLVGACARTLNFPVKRVVAMALPQALRSVAFCFALLGLESCELNESRNEAEALAERYFAASAAGNYDAVLSLYSQEFFAKTPREQFRGILVDVRGRCGAPKAHTLKTWNAFASFTNGSSQVNLLYEVTYDRCRVSERMTIVKPEGGPAKIFGHYLNIDAGTSGQAHDTTTA
jgi:hypothetical protein